MSHHYDGEAHNIEFVIESVDGEIIGDDNHGEDGADGSENKKVMATIKMIARRINQVNKCKRIQIKMGKF
jgi:hypothetical protein